MQLAAIILALPALEGITMVRPQSAFRRRDIPSLSLPPLHRRTERLHVELRTQGRIEALTLFVGKDFCERRCELLTGRRHLRNRRRRWWAACRETLQQLLLTLLKVRLQT